MTHLASKRILGYLLGAVSVLISVALQAGPIDPGPRPTGTVSNKGFCPDNNPPTAPDRRAKFPNQANCLDIVQPQDKNGLNGSGDLVNGVDALGNIVGAGNLAGLWFNGLDVFEANGAIDGPRTGDTTFPGLGPSFNSVSCFRCHSQPAVGGSSPNRDTPGFPNGNPQVEDAPTLAQLNNVSSFIHADGPVREVRFINDVQPSDPNTAFVGGGTVAELFVVDQTRNGAAGECIINQEDFPTQVAARNVIFRIPTPTFGAGLVEAIPDENLRANLASEIALGNNINFFNPPLGIQGSFNINGNDNTISRFGWKAQNKSLLTFAAEAANVELGVTNEQFPNERTVGNGQCSGVDKAGAFVSNLLPEDQTVVPPDPTDPGARTIDQILATFGSSGVASDISSLIENAAVFMRLNAAPRICNYDSSIDATGKAQCNDLDTSAQRGQALFGSVNPGRVAAAIRSIGCVVCHTDALSTGPSQTPALNVQLIHPFSDFAIHHMGGLADSVSQGTAGPDEFRTAPLWGLGQRLFFLHDGRHPDPAVPGENPLLQTILDHCIPPPAGSPSSEACQTVNNFNLLPEVTPPNTTTPSKQDLINFLRSL